jgi:hypothetical protein
VSFDKMSDDEVHEWQSFEFLDALQYGTQEEVIACLKKLDRLDREYIEILVQQLEDSTPPHWKFYNKFRLVSAPGKPPSIAAIPLIRQGIRRYYRKCMKNGGSSKQAVFEIEKMYQIKRTLIMQIISEPEYPEEK